MSKENAGSEPLVKILSPVVTADFFNEYWEKQSLHISRNAPQQFNDLLSLSAIDQLLSSQTTYFPNVQLTRSANPIAVDDYTADGREILPIRLLELYAAGATVVISQAQLMLSELGQFCRAVQTGIKMRCQTNIYLSPPANQGFSAHYDTHDVFILQVSGAKTFRFYTTGADLPFTTDQYDPALKEGAEKTGEVTLQPGDTLYIPRGLVHDAVAHETEPSLHITLGLYPIVFTELLQELVQVASETDNRYRRSVQQGFLEEENTELFEQTRSLLEHAMVQGNLHQAMSRLLDDMAMNSRQNSGGLLSRLHSPGVPALHSQLVLREQMVLGIEFNNGVLKLRSFGQILEFVKPMSDAFVWLREHGQCRVAELPLRDDEQKLAFCRQLLQANLIEMQE